MLKKINSNIKQKVMNKTSLKNSLPWFVTLVCVVVVVVLVYIGIEQNNKPYICSSILMGNKSKQTVFGENSKKATEKVKDEISRLEETLSYEIKDSDIERLNSNAGSKWIKSSDLTVGVLEKVISIAKRTHGIFDPTCLKIIKLYGLNSNFISTPKRSELLEAVESINYRKIKIERDSWRIMLADSNLSVTLEPILNGAACQKAIEIYQNCNLSWGSISIGNVTGVYNSESSKRKFIVPIMHDGKSIASAEMESGFVASSGIKLNNNEKSKIINSKTGEIKENTRPIYVFHSDGVVSCVLSYVCALLEINEISDILNYYGAEAILIENQKIMPIFFQKEKINS
ncbi:MAG: FAD:protein FMN transferase [Oscillospiraceae bacterium]|nr:FAD:protein FMN transferase [Oscillospiraceae bacterium]